MKRIIMLFILAASTHAFAGRSPHPFNSHSLKPTDSDTSDKARVDYDLETILNEAEDKASVSGRKILENARMMINNQEIVLGSCWDYINAIYDRSVFPSRERKTIFKSKLPGPYADINQIQGGDWLYFINHSYNDVEHSSIFVAWIDYEAKIGLMISYAGGNQAKPARYKTYDLRSVYNIIRPRH